MIEKKTKWGMRLLTVLLVSVLAIAPLSACSGKDDAHLSGRAVKLAHADGIAADGTFDSSLFYRNNLTVFGGDSDVIWVSKEQDAENGGYFYMYTSGNGGVYTKWFDGINHSYGISCLRSKNLNDWELCGAVDDGFAARFERDDWVYNNIWAPEVIYDEETEKYFMFFSAASWTDDAHMDSYRNVYGEGRDYIPNDFHLTTFVADKPQGPFRALTSAEFYTFKGQEVVKNDAGQTVNKNGDVITSKAPTINFEDHFKIADVIKEMYADSEIDYKKSPEYTDTMLKNGVFPAIDASPFIDYDENGNRKLYLFFSKHWINGVLSIWGMEMKDWCTPNYESMRMIAYPNAQSVKYTGNGKGVWDDASYERVGDTADNEGTLVEGAQMLAHTSADGVKRYYLTYSHTGYAARDYGCHQAISTSLLGDDYEYTKLSRKKSALGVNTTNDYLTGVGHHAYVEAEGELFITYWVHADPTKTDTANQNGRAFAFDRQTYTFDPELGYDILYGNGPTQSLQPLPKVATGLDNVALSASVSASNASDVEWVNDGTFPVLDYFLDRELKANGRTVITLAFDESKEISAILVYNSALYDYAFSKVDNILFTLSEQPAWFTGEYTGKMIISDLSINTDGYNDTDPENRFMRQGGGAVASFNPIKVSKIEIEISSKLNGEDGEIRVAEIAVLGK